MGRLDGRVALITGGGSGIGAGAAALFAEEGARIAVLDVNRSGLEAVTSAVEASGGQCAAFEVDVTDPAGVEAALRSVVERFGRLDITMNNAIRMAPGLLLDVSLDEWRSLLAVGLDGTFIVSTAAARVMRDLGNGGSIINLSSTAGFAPYTGAGAYSTCKAGIIMFTKQAALEWAPHGIRVNAICPGHVETPLTAYLQDPEIRAGREAVTPLRRVGQPIDIAQAALYLASDDADWVTASALVVDGGMLETMFEHMPGRKWKVESDES